jgi:hypothetical protein
MNLGVFARMGVRRKENGFVAAIHKRRDDGLVFQLRRLARLQHYQKGP